MNPANLVLRFLLEVVTLLVVGFWAFLQFESWLSILAPIFLVLLLTLIWGVFAVKDDPSRSGKTVVPTKGWIRLIIELLFFGLGVYCFSAIDYSLAALVMSVAVFLHYAISYRRVEWLLKQ